MKTYEINNISQKGRKGQGEKVCFKPRFKNGDGRSVSDCRRQLVPKAGGSHGKSPVTPLFQPSAWNVQETQAS